MKTFLKILKWLGIVLAVLLLGVYLFVILSWNKKWDAPYPNIKASKDSAIIARGKYLAFGPAHCATCHVPMDKIMEVEAGMQMPLSGGWTLEIDGFGSFHAPNLTPDPETGIGKLSDQEIARALRYGVGSDGRLIFPFMPFTEMSDEDLTAVISYLRTLEPVKNDVPRSKLAFLGKALVAFGMLHPEGPASPPPASVVKDSSANYGKYLAYSVANCKGCHTNFDKHSGEIIGKPFAGGFLFEPDAFSEGYAFMSPNLTPDAKTGIMADWDQGVFMQRFRKGRVFKGSPMPWGAFSRMDDEDLKALYAFFHSIEPVEHLVEKVEFAPGEPLPKQ